MTRRLAAGWSIGLGLGAAVLLCLHQPLGHWLAVLPLPQCRFHQLTGFLCPACGNTRAVLALLQGHPLRSIGYNPMIFTLFAALTCLYAELVCTAVGKPRRILPRSNALLFLTVGIVLGYDICGTSFRQSPYANKKYRSPLGKRYFFRSGKAPVIFHGYAVWRSSDGSSHDSAQPGCDNTA